MDINCKWVIYDEECRSLFIAMKRKCDPCFMYFTDPLNHTDQSGYTPLLYSIKNNLPLKYIEVLLHKGANPNLKNNNEITPMHEVCKENKPDELELFIKYGGNVNIRDKYGKSPLCYACKFNHGNIVKILLQNDATILIDKNHPVNILNRKYRHHTCPLAISLNYENITKDNLPRNYEITKLLHEYRNSEITNNVDNFDPLIIEEYNRWLSTLEK